LVENIAQQDSTISANVLFAHGLRLRKESKRNLKNDFTRTTPLR
jgi:hypothetical protein